MGPSGQLRGELHLGDIDFDRFLDAGMIQTLAGLVAMGFEHEF